MPDASALVAPVAQAGTSERSDAELVARASEGATDARDELARRYRGPAYVLALQLLGNRDDALDVAQDAMLKLFSGLHRIRPGGPVRPWLLTIVRNLARDLWRRRRVRRAEPIDASADGLALELVDTSPTPEVSAERVELRRRVWRALARLSADHREIIVLRDFHDLSYGEIAGALEIKLGTVMSRLHAARRKLRAGLAEENVDA
jgi:RNA polymerase sigma-70 factor (ECF subfamily)